MAVRSERDRVQQALEQVLPCGSLHRISRLLLWRDRKAGQGAMDAFVRPPHPNRWMQGRVKRKLALQDAEERSARAASAAPPVCALCGRLLGSRVEWHHRVPKSEGGTEMVPVHPICHRTIHAHVSNHELAAEYADLDALRQRADMQRFLRWIANKPADFHAPTRRSHGD